MRLKLIILLLTTCHLAVTQERAGLIYGKYNGINALSINPAFSFNSANKWDVQLSGGHLFAQTNYAHITNANIFKLLKADSDDILIRETPNEVIDGNYPMEVLFNQTGSTFIDVKTEYLGPGFLVNIGEKIKVGISTKVRAMAASYKIPELFNYYAIDNIDSSIVYKVDPALGKALALAELNLHGSIRLSESINIGANLKILKGIEGFSAQNEISFDVKKFNENNLDVLTDGSFEIQHTEPSPSNETGLDLGIGMDLGVTLKELTGKGSQLGISLLDIGYLNFDGSFRNYTFNTELELDSEPYKDINELAELDAQLEQDFDLLSEASSFYVQLPTALSIQYRQEINEHTSLEGHWIQRLNVMDMQMARSNSLNLTGVYDRKHFSAFLPVTLYNYNDLRVGAAVRIGVLTIGSDHILSFLEQTDFSGTDLYVNLNIYPFKINSFGKKGSKNVQCYW